METTYNPVLDATSESGIEALNIEPIESNESPNSVETLQSYAEVSEAPVLVVSPEDELSTKEVPISLPKRIIKRTGMC